MPRRRSSYQPSLKTPEKEEDNLVIAGSNEESPQKLTLERTEAAEHEASTSVNLAVPRPSSGVRTRGKGRLVRSEKHVSEDDEEGGHLQEQEIATETTTHILQPMQLPGAHDEDTDSQKELLEADVLDHSQYSDVTGSQQSTDLKLSQQQQQNLSLEALCQAARSELQIISKERGQGHPVEGRQGVQDFLTVTGGEEGSQVITSNILEQGANVVVDRPPGEGDVFHLVPISTAEGGDAWMLRSASSGYKSQVKVISGQGSSSLEESRSISVEGPPPDASFEYVTDEEGSVMTPPQSAGGRRRKHPQKPGKYICKYCGRGCAKPSVLEKHVRAHTGERPYPCATCGFSFKTKSNLYKHRKSRAHQVKAGIVVGNSTSIDSILTSMESEDNEQDDKSFELEGETSNKSTVTKPARMLLPAGNFVLPDLAPKGQPTTGVPSMIGGKPEQSRRVIVLNTSQASQAQSQPGVLRIITPQAPKPEVISLPAPVSQVPLPPKIRIIAPSSSVAQSQPQMVKVVQLPSSQGVSGDVADVRAIMASSGLMRSASLPSPSSTMTNAGIKQESAAVTLYKSMEGEKSMKVTFELPKPNVEEVSSVMTSPPEVLSAANISKLPALGKNVTPNECKDRISYLISANQAIVNTPMAEPPRPKRMMRQRSEIIERSKSDMTSTPLGGFSSSNTLTTSEADLSGNTLGVKEKIVRAASFDVSQLRKLAFEKDSPKEENNSDLVKVIPLSEVQHMGLTGDNTRESESVLSVVNQDGNTVTLSFDTSNHLLKDREAIINKKETGLQMPRGDGMQISDEESANNLDGSEQHSSLYTEADHKIPDITENIPEGVTAESQCAVQSEGEPVHIFLESHDQLDGEFTEEGKNFACLDCQSMFMNLNEVMGHLVNDCPAVHNSQGPSEHHKIHVFSDGHQSTLNVVVKPVTTSQPDRQATYVKKEPIGPSSQLFLQQHVNASGQRKGLEPVSPKKNTESEQGGLHLKIDRSFSVDGTKQQSQDTEMGNEVDLTVSSRSKSSPYRNFVMEVVDPTAPLRRGRPKGSKNRPKASQSYDSMLSVDSGDTAYVGSWKTPPIGSGNFSFPINVTNKTSSPDEPTGGKLEVVQYPVTEGMFKGYRSATTCRTNTTGMKMSLLNVTSHSGGLVSMKDEGAGEEEQPLTGSSNTHQAPVEHSTPKDYMKRRLQSHILMKRSLSTEKQLAENRKRQVAPSGPVRLAPALEEVGHSSHHLQRSISMRLPRNQKVKDMLRMTKSLEETPVPKRPKLKRQSSVFEVLPETTAASIQGNSDLEFILQKLNLASQLKSKTGLPHTVTKMKLKGEVKVTRQKKWRSDSLESEHIAESGMSSTVEESGNATRKNARVSKISDQTEALNGDNESDRANTVSISKNDLLKSSIHDTEVLKNINGLKRLDKILPRSITLAMNELMLVKRSLSSTDSPCNRIPRNVTGNLPVVNLPKVLAMKIPGFLTPDEVKDADEPVSKKMMLMDKNLSEKDAGNEEENILEEGDKLAVDNGEKRMEISDDGRSEDGERDKSGSGVENHMEVSDNVRSKDDRKEEFENIDKSVEMSSSGNDVTAKDVNKETDTAEEKEGQNEEKQRQKVGADAEEVTDDEMKDGDTLMIATSEEEDSCAAGVQVSLSQDTISEEPVILTLSDGSHISTEDSLKKDVTSARETVEKREPLNKTTTSLIPQRLQDHPSVVLMYLGHSYPVLDAQTHCTLCSLTKPQPLYAKLAENNRVSMYSTWHAAGYTPNPEGLTTKEMFSSYKTLDKTDQTNSSFMTAEGETTVLTESSTWDKNNEVTLLPEVKSNDTEILSPKNGYDVWNTSDNTRMSNRQCICTAKVFVKPQKVTPLKKGGASRVSVVVQTSEGEEISMEEATLAAGQPVALHVESEEDVRKNLTKAHSTDGQESSLAGDGGGEYTMKQITYTPGEQQYLVWSGRLTQQIKRLQLKTREPHHLSAHGLQGFKSEDQYEYVRGRGRGKYVCQNCGIRCKKPSMLRKHFRTHTDLRPYHCKYCNFAFKTKGNLTKHMKSKAHHRKCVSMGLSPIPTLVDDSCILSREQMAKLNIIPGDEESSRDQTVVIDGSVPSEHGENLKNMGSSMEDEEDDSDSESEDGEDLQMEVEEEQVSLDNMLVIGMEEAGGSTEMEHSAGHGDKLSSRFASEGEGLITIENTETGEPMFLKIVPGSDGKARSEIVQVLKDVPVVDKEAADSLLELARREVKNAMSGTLPKVTEGGDKQTPEERLGHLIGALLKKTSRDTDRSQMLKNPAIEVINKPNIAMQQDIYSSSLHTGSGFIPPNLSEQGSAGGHPPKLPLVLKLPPGHYNVDETVRLLSQLLKGIIEDGQQVVIRGIEATNQLAQTASNQLELVQTGQMVSTASLKMVDKPSSQQPVFTHVVSTGSNRLEPIQASQFRSTVSFSEDNGQNIADLVRSASSGAIMSTSQDRISNKARPPKLTILQRQAVVERQMKLQKKPNQSDESSGIFLSKSVSQDQTAAKNPTSVSSFSSVDLGKMYTTTNSSSSRAAVVTTSMSIKSYLDTLQKQAKDTNDEANKQKASSKMGSCLSIMPIPGKVIESELSKVEGGKYTCPTCAKVFQEGALLQQHLRVHEFEHLHRCVVCSLSFKSLELLEKHQRSESHESVVNMKKKLGLSESTDPRPFKCDDCNIAFRNHGHLLKHLRSKSHVMQLEGLGKLPPGTFFELEKLGTQLNFSDADTFLQVVRTMIQRGEICDESTPHTSHVESQTHVTSSSVNVVPQNPLIRSSSGLIVHARQDMGTSIQAPPQIQHVDPGLLKTSEGVTVELVVSEPKFILPTVERVSPVAATPLKCGICGRAFEQIVSLQEHLASHAELRPYVCEFCDAGFTTAKSLQTHLKSHTPSKKKYICGECGDVFTEVVDLVNHSSQNCKAGQSSPHHQPNATVVIPSTNNQSNLVLPQPARIDNQSTLVLQQVENQPTVILPPPAIPKLDNQSTLVMSSSQRADHQPKLIFSQSQRTDSNPTFIFSQPHQLEKQPTIVFSHVQKTDNQPTYVLSQPPKSVGNQVTYMMPQPLKSAENQPTLVIPTPQLLATRGHYSASSLPAVGQKGSTGTHSRSAAVSTNQFHKVTSSLSSSGFSVVEPSVANHSSSPQISIVSTSSGIPTHQSLSSSSGDGSNIQVIPMDGSSVQMRQILQKQEDGSDKEVNVMVINWDSLKGN